jgi:hypothetical protein
VAVDTVGTNPAMMTTSPITSRVDHSRFQRVTPVVEAAAKSPLVGHARPGDTIALIGGSVVRDDNGNGLVDGTDALVRGSSLPRPARHIDVRA